MKKLLTILAAAVFAATTFAVTLDLSTVTADTTISDGATVTGTLGGNYKVSIADNATVTLRDVTIIGVDSESYRWAGITCEGNATLVLEGTNSVKGFFYTYPGIFIPEDSTLTIEGDGMLTARTNARDTLIGGAGIGGGSGNTSGNIVINGGTIVAEGLSAGIGGRNHLGHITINGGNITAKGTLGPGIGGKDCCGDITINGGNITAKGSDNCAGIGGGAYSTCGDIFIGKGIYRVVATKGRNLIDTCVPIGAGAKGTCGSVSVASGLDDVTKGFTRTIAPRQVDGASITEGKTLYDDAELTGTLGGNYRISIEDGATVTISNVVINGENRSSCKWAGLTCEGDATIILKGENSIRGFYEDYPGIYVPFGKTLTIKGDGTLTASSNGYGAGIGAARNLAAGFIVIESGTITATGGSEAAGIGGAYNAMCSDISIYKGTVTAIGGDGAAGIGGGNGNMSACGIVTVRSAITRVTATCGTGASPIGAGAGGYCDSVTVSSSLLDTESGTTRTIRQYSESDLGTLGSDEKVTLADGTIVTGTLGGYRQKVSIADGAAVVLNGVTIAGTNDSDSRWAGITCEGDATIILKGENTVTGFYQDYPGIHVPAGKTLTIKGTGSLVASSNGRGAGIGSGYTLASGNVVIEGGTITATGGNSSAGIGGGFGVGADSGNITISGGTVTATGGSYAAGIGGGSYRTCGYIAIGAGVTRVEATSGSGCETAIGAGNSGTCEGVVVDSALYDETIGSTRTIVAWTGSDLASVAADRVISGGSTIGGTLGGNYKISIAAGATVRLSNATISGENDEDCAWAGITCLGDATIILEGENSVTGFYEDYPGIYVPEGCTLTIKGSGSLTAASNGWGAGIGGGYEIAGGNVVIEGGTITATGGNNAAGIGCGDRASYGNITISGGTVTATGGSEAAGIGSGANGASCGDIKIGTGVNYVWATKGDSAYACIGRGDSGGTVGTVTVGGKTGEKTDSTYIYRGQLVALSGLYEDYTAKDGDVMTGETSYGVTIPGGATVTVNGVAITGAGGSDNPTPEFAADGKAATTAFVQGTDGKWTLTTYAELGNDAVGADVTDAMIKVYAADSVEGLKTATPMTSGVTVTEKKSAVKTTIEVMPPEPTASAQFFKVTFGE